MKAGRARSRLAKGRSEIAGPQDLWLVVRMCLWCGSLRLLKRFVPLQALVELVRCKPAGRLRVPAEERKVVLLARWTCQALSTKGPWSTKGSCLERALLTYRYLTGLGADPTLVIGVRPADRRGDPLSGHAWVTLDGAAVHDTNEALDGFLTVLAFASDGRRIVF